MHAWSFVLLLAVAPVSLAAETADLDREMILTPLSGADREDLEIGRWQRQAAGTGASAYAFERLGWALVAKARRTHDAGFYKLAEKTADVIDAKFGSTADARLLRGYVLHNLHRFSEAEVLARRLVAERGSPNELGLLSDALIEQGKLDEGVAVLQRMVNAKPGAESFGRIAHVRWLKGDLPGALAAMESAVRAAAGPGMDESYAWLLVRCSGLHLQAGDAARALALAEAADRRAPDYPPALLARGRALLASGKTHAALAPLRRAAELSPLPELLWWLAEALRAIGREGEAAKVEARIRAQGAAIDPRTLALFLATRGEDAATAVRWARAEFERRADVFTHDALAWALAASGEWAAAETAMNAALAHRTKDARLFLHAGMIALARGKPDAAAAFFAHASAAKATLTPSERLLLEQRMASAQQRAE